METVNIMKNKVLIERQNRRDNGPQKTRNKLKKLLKKARMIWKKALLQIILESKLLIKIAKTFKISKKIFNMCIIQILSKIIKIIIKMQENTKKIRKRKLYI